MISIITSFLGDDDAKRAGLALWRTDARDRIYIYAYGVRMPRFMVIASRSPIISVFCVVVVVVMVVVRAGVWLASTRTRTSVCGGHIRALEAGVVQTTTTMTTKTTLVIVCSTAFEHHTRVRV